MKRKKKEKKKGGKEGEKRMYRDIWLALNLTFL